MRRADKPLRYGEHARDRMRQRSIREDQTERTVHDPQSFGPPGGAVPGGSRGGSRRGDRSP